jgi:peptide/nickel transport system ATP-binding protein
VTDLVEIRGLNIRFTGARTVYAVNDLKIGVVTSGIYG